MKRHPAAALRTAVAGPGSRRALRDALEGHAVVINTVGPFTELGEPVVRAAVEAGVHYLDTTGEQGFIRRIANDYSDEAAKEGVVILPARAFEYALGCCLGSQVIRAMGGSVDRLDMVYALGGGMKMSRGTAKSILRAVSTPSCHWANGRLHDERFGDLQSYATLPGGSKKKAVLNFPGGEPVLLPRNHSVAQVRSWMVVSEGLKIGLQWLRPFLWLAQFGWVRSIVDAVLAQGRAGPKASDRESSRFTLVARGALNGQEFEAWLDGCDPYGLTAEITVEAAYRLVREPPSRGGVWGPSAVFDTEAFLKTFLGERLTYHDPRPRRRTVTVSVSDKTMVLGASDEALDEAFDGEASLVAMSSLAVPGPLDELEDRDEPQDGAASGPSGGKEL